MATGSRADVPRPKSRPHRVGSDGAIRVERRRLAALLVIMAAVGLGSTAVGIAVHYRAELAYKREGLLTLVRNRVEIIERLLHETGDRERTLSDLRRLPFSPGTVGNAGRLTLAGYELGKAVVLFHSHDSERSPGPAPPDHARLSEPMRRALAGLEGTMIDRGHPEGRAVLAAYHPIRGAAWGLVVETDLEEIRRETLHAAAWALAANLLLLAAGGALFFRVSSRVLSQTAEREARFETLFEHSPLAIWEEDFSHAKRLLDGLKAAGVDDLRAHLTEHPELVARCAWQVRILRMNRASLRFFEARGAESAARALPAYFTEESFAVFREELLALAAGQRQFDCEMPVLAGSRGRRVLRLSLTVVPGFESNLKRVVVSWADVTEQLATETALRASEEHHRRLVDRLQAGVVVHAADTTVRAANPRACELFGLSLDETLGRSAAHPAWHFLRADGTAMPIEEYPVCRVLDSREPLVDFVAGIRRPGSTEVRWLLVHAFPELDESGAIREVLVTFVDITAARRAQDALVQSERRLRVAADTANLGTWHHDLASGRIELDERTAEQFHLGRETSFEEVLSRVHPDDREAVRTAYDSGLGARSASDRIEIEYRVLLPDGELRWLHVFAHLHFEGEGDAARPVWSVGTSQEITERKRAEEMLLRARKLEALGTFAGGVAHDFNNLLMAIRGNATLAGGELPPAHPAQSLLSEIDRAGARAAGLVRQMLDFSRPGRSETVDLAVAPLAPIVVEAIERFGASVPGSIEIVPRWGSAVPGARIDPEQVRQAVVHLVTNAVDAIGSRPGRVVIELCGHEVRTDDDPEAPGTPRGRYARLSVIDDGPGIERSTLSRVFDPFFTTKETGRGTGLGLSIVHGIMRGHGGFVALDSTPGSGTAVRLYFPAAEVPLATHAPAEREGEGAIESQRRELLLFVDDDDALVQLAQRFLGRLGYRLSGYTDPIAALRDFRERPDDFDGVISDVSMPRLSGFELAAQVLALRPQMPVVITSGYIREEDEVEAARLGVRAVIPKPDSIDEMARALDRIFHSTRA